MISIINTVIHALGSILSAILSLLPDSPFVFVDSIDTGWLAAINWILPVSVMIAHLEAFAAAVAIWYGIRIVFRWIKAASG